MENGRDQRQRRKNKKKCSLQIRVVLPFISKIKKHLGLLSNRPTSACSKLEVNDVLGLSLQLGTTVVTLH